MGLLIQLGVWGLVASVALALGMYAIPSLAVAWLILWRARPEHPWGSWFGNYLFGRRGRLALFLFVALGAATTTAGLYFLARMGGLMQGEWGNLLPAAISGGGLIIAGYMLASAARKDPMNDIFRLANDPGGLDEFLSQGTAGHRPSLPQIDPAELAAQLKGDVIGQDPIIDDVAAQVARRIRHARASKPLGVFLFVGATGAGKTELAKSLANHAFEGRLSRVDCNELTESHAAQRLIGAPPGYIGSEQGGQLTRDIMRLGSGVILLDEIEKAHEAVIRVIMGLMDEGRLTEASTGQVADASQFVIVMTSNAAHTELAEVASTITDPDERRRAVKDTLAGHFRPEQLARIDEIHCFAPLDRRALVQIVGKFLFGFAAEAGVQLVQVDTALLIDTVLKHERGAKYGIRELIRLIEKAILDGMLDRRDEGYTHVAIRCEGAQIFVEGVPGDVESGQVVGVHKQRGYA